MHVSSSAARRIMHVSSPSVPRIVTYHHQLFPASCTYYQLFQESCMYYHQLFPESCTCHRSQNHARIIVPRIMHVLSSPSVPRIMHISAPSVLRIVTYHAAAVFDLPGGRESIGSNRRIGLTWQLLHITFISCLWSSLRRRRGSKMLILVVCGCCECVVRLREMVRMLYVYS